MDKIKAEKSRSWKIDHVGVVVRHLDRAIKHYQSLGIRPFVSLKNLTPVERRVLGKPINVNAIKLKVSMARMDPIGLEFIQPSRGKSSLSLWKRFLESKGEGINHLAFSVKDLDKEVAKLEKKGVKILYQTRFQNGGGAVYFDTGNIGGVIFELVQWPP